jgi:acetylornithine deacetylase/succinyl-diaminopimelate desuccinylase-like protein
MDDFVFPLALALDVASLTMSLVNIASPRGREGALADSIEAALRNLPHLAVERAGQTVIAHTSSGPDARIVVAARLDVASEQDPLAYVEMGKLFGPGASTKGALAVTLKAATMSSYGSAVTFICHAGGPNADEPSGLGDHLRESDFVLLAEPTNCAVLGGALDHPLAQRLIGFTGVAASSDASATADVAGLARLDVHAVAFGPGDPLVAGTPDEFVPTAQLAQCEFVLRQWLLQPAEPK